MELNQETSKHGLILTLALLASFAIIAAAYLHRSANAAPRRALLEYRTAPYWRNHVPYEVGYSDYGLYRHFVLPDGTVTGPVGPDANGG
jgi:hypothetical protein